MLNTPKTALSLVLVASLFSANTSLAAPDCTTTAWKPSNGLSCAKLGLNSNKAVCEAGHKFATLCDDTKTQIRTCVSKTPCSTAAKKPSKAYLSTKEDE